MESLLGSTDSVHANKAMKFLQTPKDDTEEEEEEGKNNFINQSSTVFSTMCYLLFLSRLSSLLKGLLVMCVCVSTCVCAGKCGYVPTDASRGFGCPPSIPFRQGLSLILGFYIFLTRLEFCLNSFSELML